jgi:hypothetical protein
MPEHDIDTMMDAFEAAADIPGVENMTADEIMAATSAKAPVDEGTPDSKPSDELTPEEAAKVEETLAETPAEKPPAVNELDTVKTQLNDVNQKYQSLLGRIEKELKPIQGMTQRFGDLNQYTPFLEQMQGDARFREHMLNYFRGGTEDDLSGIDLTDPKQAREFYRKEALRAVEEREQALAAQNAKAQADKTVQGFAQGFQKAREKAVQEQKLAEPFVDTANKKFWADFHKGDVVKYAVLMEQYPQLLAEAEAKGKAAGIEEMKAKIAEAKAGGKRTVTVPTTTTAKPKTTNTGAGGDGSDILAQMQTVTPFSDEWNKLADDYEAATGKSIF